MNVEQALRRYESKREEIYKELEIAFIQEKVKNRLLRKENDAVEVLFYNKSNEISNLLEDSDLLEELLSENVSNSNDDHNELDDIRDSSRNNSDVSSNMNKVDNRDNKTTGNKAIDNKAIKSKNLSEFLDLEAEYSGSSEDENEEDGDLSEIIDEEEDIENSTNLEYFMKEKTERDEEILRNLKQRYSRKNRQREDKEIELEHNFDSEEEFPAIKDFLGNENEVINFNDSDNNGGFAGVNFNVLNKKMKIEQKDDLFENEEFVIEKMNRKEEKKSTGFFEMNP